MSRAELLASQPTELKTDEHWKNLALSCKQKSGTEDEFSSHWTGLAYTQRDANSDPGVEDRLQNQNIESFEGVHPPSHIDNVLPNVKTPRVKPLTSIRPSHEASVFTEESQSSILRSSDDQDNSKIVATPEVARSDNGITTISSEECFTRPVDFADVSSSSSPEAMIEFVAAVDTMNDGFPKARKRTKTGCLSTLNFHLLSMLWLTTHISMPQAAYQV